MASIVCTTITLILVAVSLFITYNVRQVTSNLEKELTIVVYFKEDVTEQQEEEIQNDMKTNPVIESAKLKTKEEWKAEMKKSSDEFALIDDLGVNPLLDSLIVKVKDVKDLNTTAEKLKKYEYVESARYGEGMVENIISIFDVLSYGAIGVVGALVLVTAFLIGNTIKLTIFSRKTEIEIMRLVGASNIAIKIPFVFEGFILGILGSVIPVLLSIYGYVFLYDQTGGYISTKIITLSTPFPLVFMVSAFLVFIGALVGMFGSWRAVRKYLKI